MAEGESATNCVKTRPNPSAGKPWRAKRALYSAVPQLVTPKATQRLEVKKPMS